MSSGSSAGGSVVGVAQFVVSGIGQKNKDNSGVDIVGKEARQVFAAEFDSFLRSCWPCPQDLASKKKPSLFPAGDGFTEKSKENHSLFSAGDGFTEKSAQPGNVQSVSSSPIAQLDEEVSIPANGQLPQMPADFFLGADEAFSEESPLPLLLQVAGGAAGEEQKAVDKQTKTGLIPEVDRLVEDAYFMKEFVPAKPLADFIASNSIECVAFASSQDSSAAFSTVSDGNDYNKSTMANADVLNTRLVKQVADSTISNNKPNSIVSFLRPALQEVDVKQTKDLPTAAALSESGLMQSSNSPNSLFGSVVLTSGVGQGSERGLDALPQNSLSAPALGDVNISNHPAYMLEESSALVSAQLTRLFFDEYSAANSFSESCRAAMDAYELAQATKQIQAYFKNEVKQGESRFRIMLNPPKLGAVDIDMRCDQATAQSTINITATKFSTFALLQSGQQRLLGMLQKAGAVDAVTLNFSLADTNKSHFNRGPDKKKLLYVEGVNLFDYEKNIDYNYKSVKLSIGDLGCFVDLSV